MVTDTATSCPQCGQPKGEQAKLCRSCNGKMAAQRLHGEIEEELQEVEDLEIEIEAGLHEVEAEIDEIDDEGEVPEAQKKRREHKRSKFRNVFVLNPSQGWMRRSVPIRNVPLMVRNGGARLRCGDCGSAECEGPMYCPERRLAALECPFCGRFVPDKVETGQENNGRRRPQNVQQAEGVEIDSEKRIRSRLDNHIMANHPQESMGMNLNPERFRELMR